MTLPAGATKTFALRLSSAAVALLAAHHGSLGAVPKVTIRPGLGPVHVITAPTTIS